MKITVEGHEYRVIDNLGYQSSAGVYAKEVSTPEGPRIAVRSSRASPQWRWWTQRERVQPGGTATGQSDIT